MFLSSLSSFQNTSCGFMLKHTAFSVVQLNQISQTMKLFRKFENDLNVDFHGKKNICYMIKINTF